LGSLHRPTGGPLQAAGASDTRPLAEYYSGIMTNRFGVVLDPDRLRWAVAENVSEAVNRGDFAAP
jgi:hypothetical protein